MEQARRSFWIFYTGISLALLLGLVATPFDPRWVFLVVLVVLFVGREMLFSRMYRIVGGKQKYEALLAEEDRKLGKPLAYTISLGSVVLIVLALRSFIAEPYQVPTGSMLPTIQLGDYIIVSKSSYGLRVPLTSYFLWEYKKPKRGDIVIFEHPNPPTPEDEGLILIKRIVALEGDVLEIKDGVLYINGEPMKRGDGQPAEDHYGDPNPAGSLDRYEEDLMGLKHPVLYVPADTGASESIRYWTRFGQPKKSVNCTEVENRCCAWPEEMCVDSSERDKPFTIPPGHVFVMGDNRDNSLDSRFWGPLPVDHIRGQALFVGYAKRWSGWFRLLQ